MLACIRRDEGTHFVTKLHTTCCLRLSGNFTFQFVTPPRPNKMKETSSVIFHSLFFQSAVCFLIPPFYLLFFSFQLMCLVKYLHSF